MIPPHPLLRRFENHFDVGEHAIEWTTRERDFFFRPLNAPVEVIWCCFNRLDYAKSLLDPQRYERAQRAVVKEMSLGLAFRFLPHPKGYEVFLRARFGLVRFKFADKLARFELQERFFEPCRLMTSPEQLQKVVASCERKVETLRWSLQCLPGERGWASVQWPWGTHEELRSLIRAMGDIIRQPEHGSLRWFYPIKPGFSGRIEGAAPSYRVPNTSASEPFLRCLQTHFFVESNKLALYTLEGTHSMSVWPLVAMSSSCPIPHERLEALQVWREFLRFKLASDEIDALLSQVRL